MHWRNGTQTWAERVAPEKPAPDKGTLDAIADLRNYLTDAELQTATPVGEEALAAVTKALIEGDADFTQRAYWLLSRLRERNSRGFQPDIPANHAETNGPDFWTVLGTLQGKLLDRMRGV